uniref:Phage protein n=1 Tax=Mesocestoides corti TaxID=53468 RepID=A0A5K3G3V9_MESCO
MGNVVRVIYAYSHHKVARAMSVSEFNEEVRGFCTSSQNIYAAIDMVVSTQVTGT